MTGKDKRTKTAAVFQVRQPSCVPIRDPRTDFGCRNGGNAYMEKKYAAFDIHRHGWLHGSCSVCVYLMGTVCRFWEKRRKTDRQQVLDFREALNQSAQAS